MEHHKSLQASIAEAATRRMQELTPHATPTQQIKDHERRQKFRRLIDPGIMRPNSRDQAMASLKRLLVIAENLIREPDNPKFKRFKRTNQIIQRDLVEPSGALEYAVQMGFEPEVQDFQPYYVYNLRCMEDLEVGAAMLKEVLDRESEKVERESRTKRDAKMEAEAVALKVKMAFLSDRASVAVRSEREKQKWAAREAHSRSATSEPSEPSELSELPLNGGDMPGPGHILGGDPPPYSDDA